MNTRHAVALAGWYLMVPPLCGAGPTSDQHANAF
jgi:hypothetical protein